MKKLLTIAVCLTLTALLHAQTTIYVKPDGTGDGTSWANARNLEDAVKNAVSGDQIWVQSGTHYPTKMLVVSDSVRIYGGFSGTENNLSQRDFSANVTIVDGQQKIGSIFRLGNSAEIDGFTIQNGKANGNPHKNGGAVWADENAIIENCIIRNNAAIANGGGVYAKGNLSLVSSTVENNTASDGANLYGNCITKISIPIVVTHPDAVAKSVDKGGSFPTLSVSATSTLPITYQWFSNTSANNVGGVSLGSSNGAQTVTYTPQGITVGNLYYYCEISNADGAVKSNVSGLHTVNAPVIVVTGCNSSTFDFGTVSFETPTEYTIAGTVNGQPLTQIWSDAVTASNCQKTTYNGGTSNNYNADCRTNPDYPGDLFSWCAVARYSYVLCPNSWRIPTLQDFINLDKALGGNGGSRSVGTSDATFLKYFSSWGGSYGGYCNASGTLLNQGSSVYYWSQTEGNGAGRILWLDSYGTINPEYYAARLQGGFTLRCVR